MHTEATEWAAKVAAQNEVETAKALHEEQLTFDWTGGGKTIEAGDTDGKEVEE